MQAYVTHTQHLIGYVFDRNFPAMNTSHDPYTHIMHDTSHMQAHTNESCLTYE